MYFVVAWCCCVVVDCVLLFVFVVPCSLFVFACCSLFVDNYCICCLTFGVCRLWFVVCGLLFVVCCLWFVGCGLLFVVRLVVVMFCCVVFVDVLFCGFVVVVLLF